MPKVSPWYAAIVAALLVVAVLSLYLFFSRRGRSSPYQALEKTAVETKDLPEFGPENDKTYNVSPLEKKVMDRMRPLVNLIGDNKNISKDQQALEQLNQVVKDYSDYSDAYFLRAILSIEVQDRDYQVIRADIDKAIQLQPLKKYDEVYSSVAEMYALRSKVDLLAEDYPQAVADLETAVRVDPSANPFGSGGSVKPDEETDPSALSKKDLDGLVSRYRDDYRVFMFRGLFYNFFSTYDERYYDAALADLDSARVLNPKSALVEYLIGKIYQKKTFWTKAAAANISDHGGYKDKTNSIALEHFQKATQLDPTFTEAWAQVAESLYSLKRYPDAILAYDTLITLDPNRSGAYNDRGLAKTYSGDYYGAISDFSKSIEIKKPDSPLDSEYESRADAYMKASDFRPAIDDYSRAIAMKFASQVFLMSLPQIRKVYPEFSGIPDHVLLEAFRQKYYPNMKPVDFYDQYSKNTKPFEDFVIAGLYENRGDSYLRAGNCKRATEDYARAVHVDSTYSLDRWKALSVPSTGFLIDAQTLQCSEGPVVSVWVKDQEPRSLTYEETNLQIDCTAGKIKSLGSTRYDGSGEPTSTAGEEGWQLIVPESRGEILRDALCSVRGTGQ